MDTFQTTPASKEKGTVFGEQCTCYAQCTCPGCPTCANYATCDASCNGTCDASCNGTCNVSCGGTCDYSCYWTDCGCGTETQATSPDPRQPCMLCP